MKISKKRLITFGIITIFIVSLLVVLYSIRNNQDTRSKATDGLIPTQFIENKNTLTDLCESAKIAEKVLLPGKFVTIIANAKSPNVKIKKFTYAFSNLDNLSADSALPKNIRFKAEKDFGMTHTLVEGGISTDILTVKSTDLDKPDLNWEGKKPKHIQVDVSFEDMQGNRSEKNPKCQVQFEVGKE